MPPGLACGDDTERGRGSRAGYGGVWAARGWLVECRHGARAVWSQPFRNIRPLRAVNDVVNDAQFRREKPDIPLQRVEFEIEMLGTSAGIRVGEKCDVAAGLDERERSHGIPIRPVGWIVREIRSTNIDGVRGGIMQLDKVVRREHGCSGQPFIDHHR